MKDRTTKKVKVEVVLKISATTLRGFMKDNIEDDVKIYTDQARSYHGLRNHESMNHDFGQYVRGDVHVNGLESFWALLKRGYHGVNHHMSPKHLHHYANEFAAR